MGWKVREEIVSKESYEQVDLPDIAKKVLSNRGMEAEAIKSLLKDPKSLLTDTKEVYGAHQAAREIIEAVERDCEIWVFSDYDADGVTSGFSFSDFLKNVTDNQIFPYYPNRSEGYGLSMEFCDLLIERKKETKKDILVITVDNGITKVEEVKYLKDNKIDVVVTDHHAPQETLPDCTIVNPLLGDNEDLKGLAGCAVAYKVMKSIQEIAGLEESYVNQYLYTVAIGTVADMMPATLENLALIQLGLQQINSKDTSVIMNEWMRFLGKKEVIPKDIGWEFGPRINACGRLEDIELAGELFMSEGSDREDIVNLLIDIEELNDERKKITKKAVEELSEVDFSDNLVCMFDASKYPAGVIGVIAGRVSNIHNRPALAYTINTDNTVSGSARSPEWVSLQHMFQSEVDKGHLLGYGGHDQAAGFSLDIDHLYDLQDSMNEYVADILSDSLIAVEGPPKAEVDAVLELKDLTRKNYESLQMFYYDKNKFQEPTFVFKDLEVLKVIKSKNNALNICLTVADKSTKKKSMIWAWGFGPHYESIGSPEKVDIIGSIDLNFIDKRNIVIGVRDILAVS